MKKTLLMVVLLTTAVTMMVYPQQIGISVGSSGDERIDQLARKIFEGQHYEREFARYRQWVASGRRGTLASSGSSWDIPRFIIDETPSARSIDRAIAAYEEALRIEPSGTWRLRRRVNEVIVVGGTRGSPILASTLPPEGGVQALLERAQRTKQDWIAEQAAAQARQQQEAARGFIELYSDVAGIFLLNEQQTTISVSEGQTITIIIENADGLYDVSVRDSEGTVHRATEQLSLSAGARVQAIVPNPAPNSPDDFDIVQNAQGGITIRSYTGTRRTVVIPETMHGVRVTEIAREAFASRNTGQRDNRGHHIFTTSLLSVIIPNTVTAIGVRAFGGNRELSSVVLSNSITTIGEETFLGCRALRSIVIPNSVTAINSRAFDGCGLTSVTFGSGLQTIGWSAFSGNSLTSINFPAGLRRIQSFAFDNNSLTSVSLPVGLTSIGESAFRNNQIQSVTISSGNIDTTVIRFAYGEGVFVNNPITHATLPANLSNTNMRQFGFEDSLCNFYIAQNRVAGTYVKNGPIWTRQ